MLRLAVVAALVGLAACSSAPPPVSIPAPLPVIAEPPPPSMGGPVPAVRVVPRYRVVMESCEQVRQMLEQAR